MEYCETDVEALLKKDRKAKKAVQRGKEERSSSSSFKLLSMKDRLLLAKDAAIGLNWLHGINNLVHGDLKTANLLVIKI